MFDELGEEAVRLRVASLPIDNDIAIEGKVWLENKRSARDSEAIEIARSASFSASAAASAAVEANTIARRSSRIAITAIVIAAITAIATIMFQK